MKYSIIAVLVLLLSVATISCKKEKHSSRSNEKSSYRSIKGDNVRLRSEPNINSKIIKSYNKGDTVIEIKRATPIVEISGVKSNWVQVTDYSQDKGWVFGSFLDKYEYSGEYIYNQAILKEKKDLNEAIKIYKNLIDKLPKATAIYGMEGIFYYKDKAQARINIINCIEAQKYDNRDFDVVAKLFIKNLKTGKSYDDLLYCEINASVGPITQAIFKKDFNKYFLISGVDLNAIKIDKNIIKIKTKKGSGINAILFTKTKFGWKITEYYSDYPF